MGTYYSGEWSATLQSYTIMFRYKVVNTYTASTNKSSCTITPQFKITHTGNWVALGDGSTKGLSINGTIYPLDNWSTGKYIKITSTKDTWVNGSPQNFTISKVTVTHDSSGKATLTLGIYSDVGFFSGGAYTTKTVGSSTYSTKTVTITETPPTKTVTVTYNGITISTFSATPPVIVKYGTTQIASIASGGTKTLSCAKKICNNNIVVGSKTLSCNGKYMATNVVVNVS